MTPAAISLLLVHLKKGFGAARKTRMSLARELLADGIAELRLPVPPETQKRLLAYLASDREMEQRLQPDGGARAAEMVSASLAGFVGRGAASRRRRRVLDVGSGAGLPGMPLALLWPQSQVTLLDSNQKKATFLRQAVIELELDNVERGVRARRNLAAARSRFDLVISRAFSDLPEFRRAGRAACARPAARLPP